MQHCQRNIALFSLLAILSCGLAINEGSPPIPRVGRRALLDSGQQDRVVRHYATLDFTDAEEYVDSLAAKRDIATLLLLNRSNTPFSHYASGAAVNAFSPEEAISFCETLEVGSNRWREAVWALRHHPRLVATSYLRQMVLSPDPHAREICYQTCYYAGWNDLLDYAQEDMGSPSVLFGLNGDCGELTLGSVATKYVKAFAASRNR